MTRDIDVVVEIMNEDVNRLVSLFEKDFYIERGAVEEAIAVRGMFNIIHNAYVLKVDFIVRKDSAFRELEFGRRRKIELEGVPMWIVSPEDLILSKLFWAKESSSEMQIKDVENLLRMVSDLDVSYIEHWVSSLGLEDIYQMARQ
ncbi:MAG: hypothetical protein HYY14_03785 [Candidatus Omnitrophica bacterium]|nr:hypothetical protein [Candidatus Omnitrophota bacterium]